MKKTLTALLFAVLISSGAFAQLMVGLSGALHMDSKLSGHEIRDRFRQGDGIFYGIQAEFVGRHMGVGLTGNFSSYDREATFLDYTDASIDTKTFGFTDYDLTLYLSYHLFGGHAFLDPFGEFGGGVLASGFKDSADTDIYNPYDSSFLMASYYWYAALGLGVNLGPIGVFGKFSYNYPIRSNYKADWNTDLTGYSGETELYPYGYDGSALFENGYLPKFRFTAGVKLIL
jgi:hypothetical protein